MPDFIIANTNEEYESAALLFKEYASWLNIDLSFQSFKEEIEDLRQMYGGKEGAIILCKENEVYIACIAIRKANEETAELKRMFVKPDFQKQGIAKMLLDKSIDLAKIKNYNRIWLDTLNYMLPAIKLYKQYGFYEIEAYYNNPNETAVYFEKKI